MSRIPVKAISLRAAAIPATIRKMQAHSEEIRKRAFDLFERRGKVDGHDLEDWLQAEREVSLIPAAELSETEEEIKIRAAVPGLAANRVRVGLLPHSIIVEGGTKKEFHDKNPFRCFDLPKPIDPDAVRAYWDDGQLTIVAKRLTSAQPARTPRPEVAAAA